MTTLEVGAEQYAAKHPLNRVGKSWKNDCGGLMYSFNASFTKGWAPKGTISTAMHVMAGSTLFFPVSYDDIQVGRFVFLLPAGIPDGHVGQVVSGQGLDALCFWASDALTVKLGDYIGFGTVRNYMAVKKATFKGVSEDYAGAIPNLAAFSGGVTPPPQPPTINRRTNEMLNLGQCTIGGVNHFVMYSVDPNWSIVGHNLWIEALATDKRDWLNLYGTPFDIPQDVWNQRSNDPGRITSTDKYAPLAGTTTVAPFTSAQITALANALQAAGVGGLTAAQLTAALDTVPGAVVKAEGAALANG